MRLACTYLFIGISALAVAFFTIILILEINQSEYLIYHFHKVNKDASRIPTLIIVIIINIGIFFGLRAYKSTIKEEKEQDDHLPEWNHIYNLERPSYLLKNM